MQRNNLTIRGKASIAQKLPATLEEKMVNFLLSVQSTQKQTQYPESMIVNIDETPMNANHPTTERRENTVKTSMERNYRLYAM